MPMRSLHGEPVFEPRRPRDLEAVEEVAVDEQRRVRPVALLHEPLQLVGIELNRVVRQLDHIARCCQTFADVLP